MNWKSHLLNFIKDKDHNKLKNSIRGQWSHLLPEEKKQIYLFLYQSLQFKIFIYLFAIDLQLLSSDLPWVLFLKLLKKQGKPIPKESMQEIVLYLKHREIVSESVSGPENILNAIFIKRKDSFEQGLSEKKNELLASAKIAKSENLKDQHMLYMEKLRKIFPQEKNIRQAITDEEKNRANQILNKHKKKKASKSFIENQNLESLQLIRKLQGQALEHLSQKKASAIDFAYLFRSIGAAKTAVDFVYKNPSTKENDWRLLDYLFNSGQFLYLVEHCQYLKSKYAGQPDSLYAVTYAEAIAYWELGEKYLAIEIMGQIFAMRPDFKSAGELLSQWKEERLES